MEVILIVLYFILIILLTFLNSLNFKKSNYSQYEINRMIQLGHTEFIEIKNRNQTLVLLNLLRQKLIQFSLVILSIVSIAAFNWVNGIFISLLVVIGFSLISNINFVKSMSNKFYSKYETEIVKYISRHKRIINIFSMNHQDNLMAPSSKEELIYLIEKSENIFSQNQKQKIIKNIKLIDLNLSKITIPIEKLKVVDKNEKLGPIVLNELHKFGHSILPVIDKDKDNIIGVLYLKDFLIVSANQKSQFVKNVMSSNVSFIENNKSIDFALNEFMKNKNHCQIVVNKSKKVIGMIFLDDILNLYFGENTNMRSTIKLSQANNSVEEVY